MRAKMMTSDQKPFVKDIQSLHGVIKRLCDGEGTIMFWNRNNDIRLMLRSMDDSEMSFQVSMYAGSEGIDEDQAKVIKTVLSLECSGYMDPEAEDHFSVREFEIDEDDDIEEFLTEAMEKINEMYEWKICGCREHIIKQAGETLCSVCYLSSTVEDRNQVTCCICLDGVATLHVKKSQCCDHDFHAGCLEQWKAKCQDEAKCPLCRSSAFV